MTGVKRVKFGLKDYLAMYRKRGLRLPISYFLENHLFDIVHGTDTHRWLPKEAYRETIENFDHGVLYMCSWTSVVKQATRRAQELAPFDLKGADYIDVGCGKGKVLCIWSDMLVPEDTGRVVGIDYSKELIETCRANLDKMGAKSIELLNIDAAQFDAQTVGETLVLYLYNPFDEVILERFLARLMGKNICLIYNNPLHGALLEGLGFAPIDQRTGWHPNQSISIYARSAAKYR